MGITLALCVVSTAIFCLKLLHTRYHGGLNRIPGPINASFFNFWKIKALYEGEMHHKNIALHEKYGPVVRIGPNSISFASPEALQIIHGARNAFPKSDFYKPTSPIYEGTPLFHLFSIQDASYHSTLKKTIAGLYTKVAVLDLEPQIDSCVQLFISRLQGLTSNGPVNFNMSLWLHFFAFDCLGEINVSKKFGFLETGTDIKGMIGAADRILHMTGVYGQAPFLLFTQRIIKSIWGVKKSNPLLMYSLAEVAARKEKPKPTSDMLNNFLKIQESHGSKLSDTEIAGSLYINLMAGHDVLAITLRTIFYYLARSPDILQKLRVELEPFNAKYKKSNIIPYAEISHLSYLDAIIHEALRIHANTGTILERVVPPQGVVIDGYTLPGGSIVGVNAWVIHRNEAIFGEDAKSFRPERWLGISNEKLIEMNRNMFSFGAGPRMCIGKNIAMMQMCKLVVEFYRHFSAALTHPEKEWSVSGGWVTKQTDMDMTLSPINEPRKSSSSM